MSQGSVKKDAPKRWSFVVDVRSPDGKRKQVRRRGFATRPCSVWRGR